MMWTDTEMKTLRTMAKEGESARKIGEALGKSRNAIIGMAFRHHIRIGSPVVRKGFTSRDYGASVRSCQWPFNDPQDDDFHFCGARPAPGKPYCKKHCDVAYRKPGSEPEK